MPHRLRSTLLALFAVLGLVFGVAGCSATATQSAPTVTVTTTVTASPGSTAQPRPDRTDAGASDLAPATATSDLTTMTVAELPPEGQAVLALIAQGGPFEYRQDDQTFQNREGILPAQSFGFYREYTVETPGSYDRGARRIVAGADGAVFYTDNHYSSFREVIR